VTVLRHNGKLYCLDSTCYHTGGPLGSGDIEEVQGESCIVCPWHTYQVTLEDGAKMYQALAMGPGNKLVPAGWKKKEKAQRVHHVERRDDGIYVQLNLEGSYDSDSYSHTQCGQQKLGYGSSSSKSGNVHSKLSQFRSEPGLGPIPGLPKRSGHVLNPSTSGNFGSFAEASSIKSGFSPSFSCGQLDQVVKAAQASEVLPSASSKVGTLTSSWEPMRITSIRREGNAGLRMQLGLCEPRLPGSTLKRIKDLMNCEGAPGSMALETTEDLLTTAHVRIGVIIGELQARPYTPLVSPSRLVSNGSLELKFAIRLNEKGVVGQHLAGLQEDDLVQVSPAPPQSDRSSFVHKILPELSNLKTIYLFGAGSGVTPLLQILQNVLDRPDKAKALRVVFVLSNHSPSTSLGMDTCSSLIKSADASTLITFVPLFSDSATETYLDAFPTSRFGLKATDEKFLEELGVNQEEGSQVFVCCGPPSYMSSLRLAVTGARFQVPSQVFVEIES